METCVTGIEIFTKLLDGESPLKCVCGQITRTRLIEAANVYTAIWGGSAVGGPRQICPSCGRKLTSETTSPVSVEEYKASRQ